MPPPHQRRADDNGSGAYPRRGDRQDGRRRSRRHAGRRRHRRVLRQSGHLGNALRRRARPLGRHAMRARPVRGRGDRCGRRLLPDEPPARGHPSASRPRIGQRRRQPAQCQEGGLGCGQRRGRARHLPHRLQRAAHRRHRGPCAAGIALGPHDAQRAGAEHRRCGCRERSAPGRRQDFDPDRARRHRLGTECRSARHGPSAVTRQGGFARLDRGSGQSLARRCRQPAADRRPGGNGARQADRRGDRRQDRLQVALADLQCAHGARCGPRGSRPRALCRRPGDRSAQRHRTGRTVRHAPTRVELRLPGPC